MTPSEWQQLKDKMGELNKRKRILEFSNATAAEWYALAHEYELIDSKANYHHCMQRAVHYAGYPTAVEEPEPLHQWQTIENMGGG